MFNKLLSIIVLILFTGCGYSPIYKNLKDFDFKISIIHLDGDDELNRLINTSLKRYTLLNTEKNYNIRIDTEYTKSIIAKNTSGDASEFQLLADAKIQIEGKSFKEIILISEKFNMKALSDKIEENEYEKNIKINLANMISRKLILKINQKK